MHTASRAETNITYAKYDLVRARQLDSLGVVVAGMIFLATQWMSQWVYQQRYIESSLS